jgi:hypothetical protein
MGLPKGLTPSIAELGKIKIGGKSKQTRQTRGGNTWRPPEKYDHFVVTGLSRDRNDQLERDKQLMDSLIRDHGDPDGKLRQIPIYLLSDDIDEILLSRYVLYRGRKRVAYCDGETATWFFGRGETKLEPPRTVPWEGEHKRDGAKVHTTLNCVINSGAARFGGVYKFRTTSIITTQQLYGGLLHIQTLTGGVLNGIPMKLVVRPMQVTPDNKPTTVQVCHIEIHGADIGEIQQKALQMAEHRAKYHHQVRAAQQQYAALLAAPGDNEDEEDQRHVAEEFHPQEEVVDVEPWTQGNQEQQESDVQIEEPIEQAEESEQSGEQDPWSEPQNGEQQGNLLGESESSIDEDFDLPD